ncbi:thiamine pyrophosphate-dependent enzyme, partial [Accumulibacter sp.]
MMNQLFGNSLLFGGNAPFVEELYENYLDNPGSVSEQWRDYFDKLGRLPGYVDRDVPHLPVINAFAEQARKGGYRAAAVAPVDDRKQVGILQMITAYRFIGDRWANLDPLQRTPRPEIPQLDPAYYGLSDADLNTVFNAGSFKGTPDHATFGQIYDALKATYCGVIGVEYMYLSTVAEKRWIQDRLERIHSKPNYTADERKRMLERLTAAETLERYLHTRYVGQKRFSLEGGESLIVAMDELIRVAGAGGVDEIVVGMAHRGRLNVLVNTLGKAPAMLFDEFEGRKAQDLSAGDVKYHMGYSSDVSTPGGPCHLTLSFNPSHLEIVNPVVVGSVYSRQRRRGENGKEKVLSVLIHGDAAVAGQGVNQEMLNFAQTRGYGVGGTIHVVVNNQIGFTTSDPRDYRSSLYCTDIFKMAEAPIFHVNGDHPEAVALVTGIAAEYRRTFKKDVVVDIVCYRKLGHNEQDEPMVTQPLMYKKIQQHPGTRKLYGDKLVAEGVLPPEGPDELIADYRAHLDRGELLYNPV